MKTPSAICVPEKSQELDGFFIRSGLIFVKWFCIFINDSDVYNI